MEKKKNKARDIARDASTYRRYEAAKRRIVPCSPKEYERRAKELARRFEI